MKVVANLALCQGYGNCVAEDSEHFDLDDEGLVVVLRDSVLDDEVETVTAAVRSCPVAALEIVDDGD